MIYAHMRVYAFNDLLKALLCVYAFLRNLPASNTRPIYFKSTGKDWLARALNCFCQTHECVYVCVPSSCVCAARATNINFGNSSTVHEAETCLKVHRGRDAERGLG